MDKDEIAKEIAKDSPAMQEAIMRGISAAYDGNWRDIEFEFSGHIEMLIKAVRAAVTPLT